MKIKAVIISLLLLLSPLTALAEGGRTVVYSDCKDIVYMGRWEKQDDGLMRGAFESGLVLRFTGTSVYLDGKASGEALIAIDGGDVTQTKLKENAVLFSGLEDKEHVLELYAAAQRTFPSFTGFSLDAGASALPSPDGKIVEFIGDSITEGYVSPNDAGNGAANSYANSYAFSVGRRLMKEYGAYFNTVAYGGICILETGVNKYGNDPLGMPERYFLDREYRLYDTPDEERAPAHKWDTSSYVPDIIVINLGTNDVYNDKATVMEGMLSFLRSLRAAYEKADIIVLIPFNNTMSKPVRKAVTGASDEKITLVDTKSWKISAGSDGLHPSPEQHARAAEYLYDILIPYIEATDAPPETDTETETEIITETETQTDKITEQITEPTETEANITPTQNPAAVPIIIAAVIIAAAIVTTAVIISKRRAR